MEINKFQYEKLGPQGELYKKNIELSQPLYKKINDVLAKIAEEEEIDFIFDLGVSLLYADEKYEITQKVVEELNKGGSAAGK